MRPNIPTTQLGGVANLALIAPVKPGFVDGFETVTYARRLGLLLKTLNGIRLAARESTRATSPLPDTVGRFGIIHAFRYAIVPPDAPAAAADAAAATAETDPLRPPAAGAYRLALNVGFDGGWEPYMRVIYRDLGLLLDTIFCNCAGYPDSRSHSFDEYIRWVRAHEIAGGLFYNESSMSVMDQRYLRQVEKIHREGSDAAEADRRSAAFALLPPPSIAQSLTALSGLNAATQAEVFKSQLRALKALYDLAPAFPRNDDRDDLTLLRFSRLALQELPTLRKSPLAASPTAQAALAPLAEALDWLCSAPDDVPPPQRTLVFDAARVQGGILSRYDGITHGCLALLRITDAAAARRTLAALPVSVEGGPVADDGIHRSVAISLPGLAALGVPAWRVDRFPQEFVEGMEARAGLLGDVRTNHPQAWRRPLLYGAAAPVEIELDTVHVALQMRLRDPWSDGRHDLHPALAAQVAALNGTGGLQVLAVEPMRSWPDAQNNTEEHFGFRDGLSQPLADGAPPATHWSDRVERGEILLGYPTSRLGGVYPSQPDALLDDGCFLAVRKIRQRVDVLDEVLDGLFPSGNGAGAARDDFKEKLMGRRMTGAPLVTGHVDAAHDNPNDFDYAQDAQGSQCPFHSHARRTNPRSHRRTDEHMPSIVRRGMSYGPRSSTDRKTERGVVFMAYCAELAEQFEVVQRWVAGGNSSGGLSSLSDPYLGMPEPGDPRVFRFVDGSGQVVRRPLGDRPFTELQWGMYLFVPSVPALRGLDAIVAERPPKAKTAELPGAPDRRSAEFHAWQQGLEDPALRDASWRRVLAAPHGTLDTDYGRLVADPAQLLAALQDDGSTRSVAGYGRRLAETVGLGYLGLDPGDGHDAQAETPRDGGVNQAIADIGCEQAFGVAFDQASGVLVKALRAAGEATPGQRVEVPVDIGQFSETVLALLCRYWFGLPDDKGDFMVAGGRTVLHDGPVRCPGHFFSVARYVFSPHPSATVADDARAHGQAIRAAVGNFLRAARDTANPRAPRLGPLTAKIVERLAHLEAADPDIVTRTVAGTVLGFPPTVHGNFLRVMRAWLQTVADPTSPPAVTSVWALQADLLCGADPRQYARAAAVLREPLLAQMRRSPVPEMIWRESSAAHGGPGCPVVLGLAGAMLDPAADHRLMFGGTRTAKGAAQPDPLATVHACPGYEMAVGVLLGMVDAILLAGTLRPTASPSVFTLVAAAAAG